MTYDLDLDLDLWLRLANLSLFVLFACLFNSVSSNLDQGEVYNVMWWSLSVTCDRSVVFSGSSDPVSSTNKTDRRDITEILLKVALSIIKQTNKPFRGGVRDTTSCDKVCQWLEAGQWFSPGTHVSSTNKTDCQDITETLLKVALNTITHPPTRMFSSDFPRRHASVKESKCYLILIRYVIILTLSKKL